LVREVVKSNNWGLNVNQITEKLDELLTPEYRKRLEDRAPKPGWKMPKGSPTRKSVGEHLSEFCADPKTQVAKIGGRYYVVDYSSSHLNKSVKAVLQPKGNMLEYNISPARNLAGSYAITDPADSCGLFTDLFEQQVKKFIDCGYWLEDILEYMIRYELISKDAYSKENGLDKRMLRESWERCFGNTRLVVFASAISPPDFLDYMMSPHGSRWTSNILEKKWDSIMERAAKNPPSKFGVAAQSEIRRQAFRTRRRIA
jgi:hypothetical protein